MKFVLTRYLARARAPLSAVLLVAAVAVALNVALRSHRFRATVARVGKRASALFAATSVASDTRGLRVGGSWRERGELLLVAGKDGEVIGGEGDAEGVVSEGGEDMDELEELEEPGGLDAPGLLGRVPREGPPSSGHSVGGASEEAEAEAEVSARDVARKDVKGETCAEYIVYDKPVKTGSSALTKALQAYLKTRGQSNLACAMESCATRGQSKLACTMESCATHAQEICDGERAPEHLLDHLSKSGRLLDCLRGRRFYAVTSIRDPLLRWESAFLYNRAKRAAHYGIPWNASYESFMTHMPPCSLLTYYDGGDFFCGGEPVQERVRKIVRRYDEIVDLAEEPAGQVHELVARFLTTTNKSPRPEDRNFRSPFDLSRLANETMLYNALRKRRVDILNRKQRPLC